MGKRIKVRGPARRRVALPVTFCAPAPRVPQRIWRLSWHALALSIGLNSSVIAAVAMFTDAHVEPPEIAYPVTLVIPVVDAAEPEDGRPAPEAAQAAAEPEEEVRALESAAANPKPAAQAAGTSDPARSSLSNYWDLVRAQIARGARYPHSASSRRIEGTVALRLTLHPDGTLEDCRALGEPHPALELAALNAVRRAAPFPAPPGDEPEARSAILPIRFALSTNQQEESER